MRAAVVMVLGLGALVLAAESSPDELAKQAIATVKHERNWQEIRISTAKPTAYSLRLDYKSQPGGGDGAHYRPAELFGTVERDTTAIARALLKTLVAAGHQPATEGIWVSVFGGLPVKGETGKDVIRPYGTTRYNPSTDSLSFERWTMP
jgi:hypothetical protein